MLSLLVRDPVHLFFRSFLDQIGPKGCIKGPFLRVILQLALWFAVQLEDFLQLKVISCLIRPFSSVERE